MLVLTLYWQTNDFAFAIGVRHRCQGLRFAPFKSSSSLILRKLILDQLQLLQNPSERVGRESCRVRYWGITFSQNSKQWNATRKCFQKVEKYRLIRWFIYLLNFKQNFEREIFHGQIKYSMVRKLRVWKKVLHTEWVLILHLIIIWKSIFNIYT